MSNVVSILQGFTNLALDKAKLLNVNLSEEGERKMKVCIGCKIFNPENYRCGKKKSELNGRKRVYNKDGCGCYLPAKVLSGESCPNGKW